MAKRALIVHPDEGVQMLLRVALDTEGWDCDWAADADEAVPLLARVQLLVVGADLGDANGLDLVRVAKARRDGIEVIVVAGDLSKLALARRLGVRSHLTLPLDMTALYTAVRDAEVVDLRPAANSAQESPAPSRTRRRR